MSYSVLPAGEAFWRPSNQLKTLNTDLAKQLGAQTLGARLWRLRPGECSTRHRHFETHELYLVLEGEGRIRIGERLARRSRGSPPCWSPPEEVRQIFNDTDADALWSSSARRPSRRTRWRCPRRRWPRMYPDGPKVPPPELAR